MPTAITLRGFRLLQNCCGLVRILTWPVRCRERSLSVSPGASNKIRAPGSFRRSYAAYKARRNSSAGVTFFRPLGQFWRVWSCRHSRQIGRTRIPPLSISRIFISPAWKRRQPRSPSAPPACSLNFQARVSCALTGRRNWRHFWGRPLGRTESW